MLREKRGFPGGDYCKITGKFQDIHLKRKWLKGKVVQFLQEKTQN